MPFLDDVKNRLWTEMDSGVETYFDSSTKCRFD